ncbi:MAG: matrixin family metalloprotease [Armatimonadetes bacterium]|nr:matrixin family metalloprotease [Armatimonadota bacterium]
MIIPVALIIALEAPELRPVIIQPLGKVKDSEVQAVTKKLQRMLAVQVIVYKAVALPKSAFYQPRSRYRAEKLLDFLAPMAPDQGSILGLTDVDISTAKGKIVDWGVFGLGRMPGQACVISSYRLGKNIEKVSRLERLARVAVHEVGHNLGLPHCPTKNCLMEDAKGLISTVDSETDFCKLCRKKSAIIR